MPQLHFPHIDKLIAIASGKGGVGKTTVTVHLALALQRQGLRVGIFDADVYGPNVPLLLGVRQTRRLSEKSTVSLVRPADAPAYIAPLERHGLQLMSVGLIVGEEQAIDPVAGSAGQFVLQTLKDVLWEDLDVLLLDLPPSAGEPQQTLLQRVELDGVVLVTTPHDLSLLDSSRAMQMFSQAGVPILGVVENMSYFICPSCAERHPVFGGRRNGRSRVLDSAPRLGEIPLDPALTASVKRQTLSGESAAAAIFDQVATAVRQSLRA